MIKGKIQERSKVFKGLIKKKKRNILKIYFKKEHFFQIRTRNDTFYYLHHHLTYTTNLIYLGYLVREILLTILQGHWT